MMPGGNGDARGRGGGEANEGGGGEPASGGGGLSSRGGKGGGGGVDGAYRGGSQFWVPPALVYALIMAVSCPRRDSSVQLRQP